jgi:hypothetical protein
LSTEMTLVLRLTGLGSAVDKHRKDDSVFSGEWHSRLGRIIVNKTLMVAAALITGAFSSVAAQPSSSVLQSLPIEVQKQIEDVRAACREYLLAQDKDPNQSWMSSTAIKVHSVSSGDDGLTQFTVSGARAVMVSDLELCGGQCLRGANSSNRGAYSVTIYIRSKNAWRKALSTDVAGSVFLSTDWLNNNKFTAMVLSVPGGNKDCPTRDVSVREGRDSYVLPAWKQSCDAVVKWDGKKFIYRPL